MISQSAEYSLRAVLCLASQGDAAGADRAALTTQQIADRTRIPAGYLSKLLQILGRAGIVSSQRGLNGGFTLSASPDRLTLLQVVSAVESSHRIVSCPLNIPGHAIDLCPLHRRLDAVAATIERMLRDTTVADIVAESGATADTDFCPRDHSCTNKEPCHARHDRR